MTEDGRKYPFMDWQKLLIRKKVKLNKKFNTKSSSIIFNA